MYVNRSTVIVTTVANGTATAFTSDVVTGRIFSIKYTKTDFGAGTSPATEPDFTITTEDTAQNIWVESNVSATATRAPRQATHDTVGVASWYNDSSDEAVEDFIYAANERVKIVIAEGGNAKVGTFDILWG